MCLVPLFRSKHSFSTSMLAASARRVPQRTALFWRVSDALNTSALSRRRVPQLCALGCAPKDSKRNDPAAPFHREKSIPVQLVHANPRQQHHLSPHLPLPQRLYLPKAHKTPPRHLRRLKSLKAVIILCLSGGHSSGTCSGAPAHRYTVGHIRRRAARLPCSGERRRDADDRGREDAPAELEHLPARNVAATAYDTEAECYDKYPEAADIVQDLRAAGAEVHFGVDATQLGKTSSFKGRKWDRIVWNFPHAGKGITDQDRNILSNQLLILGFLRSAAGFLGSGPVPEIFSPKKRKQPDDDDEGEEDENMSDDHTNLDDDNIVTAVAARGTILLTLRNVVPYTSW
ncbi:hypothetical protein B0H14DRAFT_471394 [Mycena olivaceomarginata]|nr:hypothetical protein B0H14DRAFT_471394 [Mycena olivaceomarginata]